MTNALMAFPFCPRARPGYLSDEKHYNLFMEAFSSSSINLEGNFVASFFAGTFNAEGFTFVHGENLGMDVYLY